MADLAEWQLVLILWGTKYGTQEVTQLVETVRATASRPFRIVLITDRDRENMPEGVIQRPFPEFFLKPEFLGPGCQAKLAMHEAGVVPQDLPSIYVDLDTVVFGDLSKFLDLSKSDKALVLFQSTLLPIGAIGRWLYRVTNKRRYARGNSSIVIYHPKETTHIAEQFRSLFDQYNGLNFKPMVADERFMSWAQQDHLQAIPRKLAVKFPTEFMLPWKWAIVLRASMPWVRRRWNGLQAVTLPGVEVKGQQLLEMKEGAEVVDRKGRRLIWSDRAIGPMKQKLTDYYLALDAREKENDQ
ncbi:hypothetical protein [Shimia sp.]|uniref:hypothetical protein n=1 Tax=Shimia sp. TaxID=1954381 RepID=UPI003B8E482C